MECSDTLRLPIGSQGRQQLPLSPCQPQLIPKSQFQAHVKASAPWMPQPDPGALAAQSPKLPPSTQHPGLGAGMKGPQGPKREKGSSKARRKPRIESLIKVPAHGGWSPKYRQTQAPHAPLAPAD